MVFQDDQLYACGPEGGEVAGHVRWDPQQSVITWFMPGGRQRAYTVAEVLEDSEERFAFIDHIRRKFVLFPLTPEHYNQHIRRPMTPLYPTLAALRAAFEASLGY